MEDFNFGILASLKPGDSMCELLSEEEKLYAAVHDVVCVPGKDDKSNYIILTPSCLKCIQVLMESRSNYVSKENLYIFGFARGRLSLTMRLFWIT